MTTGEEACTGLSPFSVLLADGYRALPRSLKRQGESGFTSPAGARTPLFLIRFFYRGTQ